MGKVPRLGKVEELKFVMVLYMFEGFLKLLTLFLSFQHLLFSFRLYLSMGVFRMKNIFLVL